MSAAAPILDEEVAGLFAGFEQRPLALAVSGGSDSMALMHMVARWARRDAVRQAWAQRWRHSFSCAMNCQPPTPIERTGLAPPAWLVGVETGEDLRRIGGTPHVVVLTVDHGLRAASSEEVRFVAEEAAKLGLVCVVLKWQGEKPATRIQEMARVARRDLMGDVLRAEVGVLDNIGRSARLPRTINTTRTLVTAHHQEDQAETFLMRLARGSGLEGLGGMRERDTIESRATKQQPHSFEIRVLRPLLDVPKARLAATLNAYEARWVEDPSNEDERFERVRVRKMLAQLGEVGLSAAKIALSARRLRDAEFDLRALMDSDALFSRSPAFSHAGLMSEFEFDPRSPFFCGAYVSARSLRQVLRGHGGAARDVELAQLEDLLALRAKEGRGSGVTLAGCKIEFLDKDGRRLRVYREGRGDGLAHIQIDPGQIVDWDGRRFEVSADWNAPQGAVVHALGMQGWADLKKTVPRLAELKWPAAAAATLPVVSLGGEVVAYPGLASVLDSLLDVPEEVGADFSAFMGQSSRQFSASFGYIAW
ncbi:MAG TPA: tRNA lysidine(34) synthetase TilS [Hyphomicrobiaceae bacterium]|nr:tRNA lysidine(34) synthetase TilS [Hyphomicrobiaceae bacterium]